MEPKTQVEIQLGHLCNNRCVFCVSGQQTQLGRALPLPAAPILESLNQAYAKGQRKLTLLGGEPTLQPAFKQVVQHAVQLGFEEVVIFTNGAKTARAAFLDEIISLGKHGSAAPFFTWRISIQGATKEAHERTTRKPGSFGRILRTLDSLTERGQRITINMCVVGSNYASVSEFASLIQRYPIQQLHLDMVRPMDAGERSEEEFAEMIPFYPDLAEPLSRLARLVPQGFDLNIGNLPYCIAPSIAPWVHHDGESTETIAVDGERDLSRPWDKYFVKRRDKFKPPSCAGCVFEPRCSGVFQKYAELHGVAAIQAITPSALRAVDPALKLFWAHMTPISSRIQSWLAARRPQLARAHQLGAAAAAKPLSAPQQPHQAPNEKVWLHGDRELRVRFALNALEGQPPEQRNISYAEIALRPPGEGGCASSDLCSLHLLELPKHQTALFEQLAGLWQAISQGQEPWYPVGEDAVTHKLPRSLSARLARIRRASPFHDFQWENTYLEGPTRAVLVWRTSGGAQAELWLDEQGGKPTGGYRLQGPATPELVNGLRAVMACLKGPSAAPADSRARLTQNPA